MGIKPREFAFYHVETLFAAKNALGNDGKVAADVVDFAALALGSVEFEPRKVDVCFRHDERIGKMERPSQ